MPPGGKRKAQAHLQSPPCLQQPQFYQEKLPMKSGREFPALGKERNPSTSCQGDLEKNPNGCFKPDFFIRKQIQDLRHSWDHWAHWLHPYWILQASPWCFKERKIPEGKSGSKGGNRPITKPSSLGKVTINKVQTRHGQGNWNWGVHTELWGAQRHLECPKSQVSEPGLVLKDQ